MAEYKVVDAEQLDAELTNLANKIREKGGTTEELDFYKSDKVYLGINADENDWRDITKTEKANFEVLWNAEILPETEATETSNYEKIIDILTGVDE